MLNLSIIFSQLSTWRPRRYRAVLGKTEFS